MTMSEQSQRDATVDEFWRILLTTSELPRQERLRHFFGLLPSSPRCKFCNAPFHGVGAPIVRLLYGKRPSNYNPRFCSTCEDFARKNQGGAEVEMAMLFADMRGSTALAEGMSPTQFSKLIDRFYQAATNVLIPSDAIIDKLSGDEVAAFYLEAFAGPEYPRRAVEASRELLRATGHGDPEGPWVPVGAGVHVGTAFFGAVGSAVGVTDITALGDAVNTAARLASEAGPGEILLSQETIASAGLDPEGLAQRQLELKGKSEALNARVMRVTQG
jgi:adenylate cyclase